MHNHLTTDAVIDFLTQHPDFFTRQPDALLKLHIPHHERGAISLVEAQLLRLREKAAKLEEENAQLIAIATQNERLFRAFANIHRALFAATCEQEIHHALKVLATSLNLTANLTLFAEEDPAICKAIEQVKTELLGGSRIYLGRLRQTIGELFIHKAPDLGSYVLVPLTKGKEFGYLAFASKDGGHFQPAMDTLFIEQLAEHIAILLAQWQRA